MKKVLEIEKKNDYSIWNIDLSDIPYNCEVVVPDGLIAYYLKNGVVEYNIVPGTIGIINDKKEEARYHNKLSLFAVARDKKISFPYGVGQVLFVDETIGRTTKCGSNCNIDILISDGWKAKSIIGKDDISDEEITDFLRSQFTSIYKENLSAYLNKYDYSEINSKISNLAEELKKSFNEISKQYGILVSRVVVNGCIFEEDYVKARDDYYAKENYKKEERSLNREEAIRIKQEADLVKELNGSND